jgi:hypothetical protein
MNIRNRFAALAGSAVVIAFAGACNPDLNVTNPNEPDVERAISTPSDVRQLIGSSYNTWYLAMQGCAVVPCEPVPGVATDVMADVATMAYGNYGARFNGQEPRLAYNNSSAAGDGYVASSPYDALYGALGAANDGLKAIERGVEVRASASAPDETEAFQAFAWMVQGLALGFEALVFNEGFVVKEDTPENTAALEPYAAVNEAALASLDKVIAAATGKSWSIPAEYTPGVNLSAANLAKMANTMAARQLAYIPRTAAENAAVNWPRVLAYADKGISTGTAFDLTVQGDGGNSWYDIYKGYNNLSSWIRIDQRIVQEADPTQPVVFTSTTAPPRAVPADLRWSRGEPDASGNVRQPGADFVYYGSIPYDPARGPYFFSNWAHARYRAHSYEVSPAFTTAVPYVLAAENDLLIAEALVRTNGDKNRAATLVNKTRVTRGGLPPITASTPTAEFLGAIFYERDVELWGTGAARGWFDRRRIDASVTYNGLAIGNIWAFRGGSNLQKGTPRSLPVPAKELETLGIPVYTFGGDGPNPVFPET